MLSASPPPQKDASCSAVPLTTPLSPSPAVMNNNPQTPAKMALTPTVGRCSHSKYTPIPQRKRLHDGIAIDLLAAKVKST